ncbi:MAG: S1/P1 nuclease [Bacteroidetes bacterium]|nr:S1/P1 nuclease [Bacteroidota bacterium]
MKKNSILIAFLAFIFSLAPTLTFAWGAEGHQIVAQIAKANIKGKVLKKVSSYLGDMSFEKAATWMDDIKSDKSLDYMKPWHYVNIEKDATYVKAKDGDIISELDIVIAELKNYKTMKAEDVAKDIKILFHLCGDIAQPLHAGYGSDKGGNEVKVKYNDKDFNLHRIWDTDIIRANSISTESCLATAKRLKLSKTLKPKAVDPVAWMNDSRTLLSKAYEVKDNTITPEYMSTNKEIVEKQLLKGGFYLAKVLNTIFG